MGMLYGHSIPWSATGERGYSQEGAWFGPWQCDEYYRMGREPGSTRQERRYPRWAVSLIKLDNGRWASGWNGCYATGPNSFTYPSRKSALRGIILRTARQARCQYMTTGPQRYLVGIEAEELQTVLRWAVGLLDRPEPRRKARVQRRTLLEAKGGEPCTSR